MITYRSEKGTELEYNEVDENFRFLDEKSSNYVVGDVFRGPVIRLYNGQLYLLSSGVSFPFTATNFATELAAGNWQLVGSGTSFKGELNLTEPVLENGVGVVGDYYRVTEAGNYDFGAGDLFFNYGDFVLYDGSVYGFYVDNNQLNSSVNVKKSFAKVVEFNGTGTNVVIPLNPQGFSEIRLINSALVSLSGVDLSLMVGSNFEAPYQGKPYIVWNKTGNSITLKNEDYTNADLPFFIKESANIVLPNNEKILFHYDNGGLFEIFRSFTASTSAKRTYYAEWKLSGAMAASTNWYAQAAYTSLRDIFYAISGLTPTNNFANHDILAPCYILPFNAKVKSYNARGFTNGNGQAVLRSIVNSSFTPVGNALTIQNALNVADVTFQLNNQGISFRFQTDTGFPNVTLPKGTEIRLFNFNNNQNTPLQSGIVSVEFEEVL